MVTATARFVRCSPRKARLVADLVRGKGVTDARSILAFSTRAAAVPGRTVLEPAVATANLSPAVDASDSVLARGTVEEGPPIRRFRPRAMGRATRIRKRTCHITIALASPEAATRGRSA